MPIIDLPIRAQHLHTGVIATLPAYTEIRNVSQPLNERRISFAELEAFEPKTKKWFPYRTMPGSTIRLIVPEIAPKPNVVRTA